MDNLLLGAHTADPANEEENLRRVFRFYGNGVCGQVGLIGLCHVFSFVLCQWLLPPTKAIISQKNRNIKFFCSFFNPVIPAPA